MFEGFKVSVCVPAGRRRYMAVGLPYLFRALDSGIVDEVVLWKNTLDDEDARYIDALGSKPKVRVIATGNPQQRAGNVFRFYPHATDKDYIYLKADDDIAAYAPDFFPNLLACRVQNQQALLVSASIVHNPLSDFVRKSGLVPTEHGILTDNTLCPIGWKSGPFVEALHRSFLRTANWEAWKTPDRHLTSWQRFSIGCICFFGRDMANIKVPQADEDYMTETLPKQIGRPNMICGSAVCCHMAYHCVRDHMDKTDVLDLYRQLSEAGGRFAPRFDPNEIQLRRGWFAVPSPAGWSCCRLSPYSATGVPEFVLPVDGEYVRRYWPDPAAAVIEAEKWTLAHTEQPQ